jgi:UTP pyrophosphatase
LHCRGQFTGILQTDKLWMIEGHDAKRGDERRVCDSIRLARFSWTVVTEMKDECVANTAMKYLTGYPDEVKKKVELLVDKNRLAGVLLGKYAAPHDVRTDKALYLYVVQLKKEFLGNADPVNKVEFDNKIHVIKHALGSHTSISRVQGNKLKSKREIRISSIFKNVPLEFLRMIAVHELAHFKEKEHDKAFYKLCEYMEPQYHQFEFDVRLYLTHIEAGGAQLWN